MKDEGTNTGMKMESKYIDDDGRKIENALKDEDATMELPKIDVMRLGALIAMGAELALEKLEKLAKIADGEESDADHLDAHALADMMGSGQAFMKMATAIAREALSEVGMEHYMDDQVAKDPFAIVLPIPVRCGRDITSPKGTTRH
jgi:hypothetical protein